MLVPCVLTCIETSENLKQYKVDTTDTVDEVEVRRDKNDAINIALLVF